MIEHNPNLQTIPPAVLRYWFGLESVGQIARVGGGLSGDLVYRVWVEGRPWGLKRHSDRYSAKRMAEVGQVVQWARQNPALNLPAPRKPSGQAFDGNAGWVEIDSRLWSCWEWCEGETPRKSQLNEELANQMVRWVANFHSTVRGLATASAPAPTIRDRLSRAKQLDDIFRHWFGRSNEISQQIGSLSMEHRQAIELGFKTLQNVWRSSFDDLVRQARTWESQTLSLQYVLRDVHHMNTILREGQLVTMIDLDAIRVDTPATDIARMTGDWMLESRNGKEAVQVVDLFIDAYRSHLPLSRNEETLVRLLVEINPLINLGNWLVWLAIERQDFGDSTGLAFSRLRGWTGAVVDGFW